MSSLIKIGNLSVQIFGESHGGGIGVVLDGLPSGIAVDTDEILFEMSRRAPRSDGTSTTRAERDTPEILSGVYNGRTGGTPVAAVIRNTDTRSSDYTAMPPRPGHADHTGYVRYGGFNDPRGGGHFSGRLTAPLVFAGSICKQYLAQVHNVSIGAHVLSIGDIRDTAFDMVTVSAAELCGLRGAYPPVIDPGIGEDMVAFVRGLCGDSVGGVVECGVVGLPAGVGSPMFFGLENIIAQVVFGIPAVKGVEFGAGFSAACMRGSETNDEYYYDTDGCLKTYTNNCWGILGGISNGMPLVFRAAFKPTPSISLAQRSVPPLLSGIERESGSVSFNVKGRHDPCVVFRAVPVVESAAAVALAGSI